MNTNRKDEVKLMNLVRFLEIYNSDKWSLKELMSENDIKFIKQKTLEVINSDLLSETLRNSSRIKVVKANKNENIIDYTKKQKELLRLEILKNIFRVDLEETNDALVREVASGNISDVLEIQKENGFFKLSEEQLEYLTNQLEKYNNIMDTKNKSK